MTTSSGSDLSEARIDGSPPRPAGVPERGSTPPGICSSPSRPTATPGTPRPTGTTTGGLERRTRPPGPFPRRGDERQRPTLRMVLWQIPLGNSRLPDTPRAATATTRSSGPSPARSGPPPTVRSVRRRGRPLRCCSARPCPARPAHATATATARMTTAGCSSRWRTRRPSPRCASPAAARREAVRGPRRYARRAPSVVVKADRGAPGA